ncbi:MAG: polynucleotide adenylyltransferase PcnB, partial [Pseudomonadota bacterium]
MGGTDEKVLLAILKNFRPAKLFEFSKKESSTRKDARIYQRDEHSLSRKNISEHALKVLYRLHNAGFEAYLVGGAVRDSLLGLKPKDFDVATNAHPEEICELFRNARQIGRRFKLVHVRFGREIIEVATFRAAPQEQADGASVSEQGRILRDNVYGELVDDAWRRDFTINALYYNIADFTIVDYVGGFEDLQAKNLRLIGDVNKRYVEDPLRLLRAIRFAAKLGVNIEKDTEQAFSQYGKLLLDISPARMFDELVKLFHCGAGVTAFRLLNRYDLMEVLFPCCADLKNTELFDEFMTMIERVAGNTDERIGQDKSVTPAFVFAAILWVPQRNALRQLADRDWSAFDKEQRACDLAIEQQLERIAIPRRFTSYIREIWTLQKKFDKLTPKRVERLFSHRRFRAAYDFLLLRHQSGEDVAEQVQWWTQYEQGTAESRAQMLDALSTNRPKRRRRKNPKTKRQ